jgi:hypothetical protein
MQQKVGKCVFSCWTPAIGTEHNYKYTLIIIVWQLIFYDEQG